MPTLTINTCEIGGKVYRRTSSSGRRYAFAVCSPDKFGTWSPDTWHSRRDLAEAEARRRPTARVVPVLSTERAVKEKPPAVWPDGETFEIDGVIFKPVGWPIGGTLAGYTPSIAQGSYHGWTIEVVRKPTTFTARAWEGEVEKWRSMIFTKGNGRLDRQVAQIKSLIDEKIATQETAA